MILKRFVLLSFCVLTSATDVSADAPAGGKMPADSSQQRDTLVEMSTHHRPAFLIDGGVDGTIVFTDFCVSFLGRVCFASIHMRPMDFTFSDDGDLRLAFSLSIEGGYNGRWIAVGAGLGIDDAVSYWGAGTPGLKATFPFRIGKRDGIRMETTSGFAWHEGFPFRWEETTARFGVPLPARYEIFFDGGVNRRPVFDDDTGQFFAGLGLGIWLNGNGEPGSVKLDMAAGVGGMWREVSILNFTSESTEYEQETNTILSLGPMVSLGLTWRF